MILKNLFQDVHIKYISVPDTGRNICLLNSLNEIYYIGENTVRQLGNFSNITDTLTENVIPSTLPPLCKTIAGTSGIIGSTNSTGLASTFDNPSDITISSSNTYALVADIGNNSIRKLAFNNSNLTSIDVTNYYSNIYLQGGIEFHPTENKVLTNIISGSNNLLSYIKPINCNVNCNNNKIINIGMPISDYDAITYKYMTDNIQSPIHLFNTVISLFINNNTVVTEIDYDTSNPYTGGLINLTTEYKKNNSNRLLSNYEKILYSTALSGTTDISGYTEATWPTQDIILSNPNITIYSELNKPSFNESGNHEIYASSIVIQNKNTGDILENETDIMNALTDTNRPNFYISLGKFSKILITKSQI